MIDLINATYEKLKSNAEADQVEEYLGEIFSTISMHFALEERMMRNAAYESFKRTKTIMKSCSTGSET